MTLHDAADRWEGLTPPYATIVVDPPWHYDEVNPPKSREGYVGQPRLGWDHWGHGYEGAA